MISNNNTPKRKPAEATIPGGLNCVSTTLSITSGKVENNDLLRLQGARV